ncbi:4Fe-4S dicluster domain-containing protein [Methanonatronarchaeum sp. AMET6-2]|uniref:4Fe-4S dicluster domain-containing protein n=1 Tax=Methanonatronarchaeum sp. AMET6-2 TaxID=2933293 RepID=UPI00120E829C|nr:4Fe-4S dicluster domain-containing protein [Methanonatronarchaeum sp. AMET6-2]RZN61146.1 MAG: 4Fe-4S dicluster domain-containing protein [Methanonatronarchaeia archaeon]UOY09795.1 4Fe-4S dicluster domain-containing protein [Methanonatronarchaeum sp. AMET6-2]
MSKIMRKITKQVFKKHTTNLFPARYAPDSILQVLQLVEKGEIELNPPVEIPPDFRGKLQYDKETCVNCYQCLNVCPAEVMQIHEEDGEEKITFYISRCTFCRQCADICPVDAIEMSDEFALAAFDKYDQNLIVNGEKTPGQLEKVKE